MNRAAAVLLASFSCAALAAPTLTGGPQFTTAQDGAAFSGYRSRFAVKADVGTIRGDLPGALDFYDARTGAMASLPLGALTLRFHESGAAVLGGARTIAFEPIGWTETRTDGTRTANIAVFTLAHDVFAVVVEVQGVSAPLTVEAKVAAVPTAVTSSATATARTNAIDLDVDSGAGDPFGVTFASASAVTASATSGTSFEAILSRELSASGTAAFVLAFHPTASNSAALATQAITDAGAATGWVSAARAAWQAHYAAYAPAQETDAARLSADAWAVATLWHNELGDGAADVRGAYPAKTERPWFEVRDTGFHALATTNAGWQVPHDLIVRASRQRRFGEGGTYPRFGIQGISEDHSELPAYGWALRALVDRQALSGQPLADVYHPVRDVAFWWRDHRDHDGDGVPELNGGFESGAPQSPRFTDVWSLKPEYPVEDTDPRPRLNASDLSATLWHEYIELWRIAGPVGMEQEQWELLRRADYLGEAIEDGTLGHWNEPQRHYSDYVLPTLEQRDARTIQTPASWWPLVVGVARQQDRVKDVIGRMLDPAQFNTPYGLTSVVRATSQGYAPEKPWSGAISPEQQWLSVIALYRYGFEAEAEALRQKLLDRISSEGTAREHYRADTGAGLGAAGFDTSAAVYVEALRNRHQAETFSLSRGDLAKERVGQIRRIFNLYGFLQYEVTVAGTTEVPVTRMTAAGQILRDEPTAIELSDPYGLVADRDVTLRFPRFSGATITRTRAGQSETLTPRDDSGEGISVTAKVGDRLELRDLRYLGEGCGCGQVGGVGPLAGALGLLVALRAGARRRRNRRAPSDR